MATKAAPVDDDQLRGDVQEELDWRPGFDAASIGVTVEDGIVVQQRRATKRAVQHLRGVRGIDNRIEIRRKPSADDAAERIENALRRQAVLDSRDIDVAVHGDTLILTGAVRSWAERYAAQEAAAASPHISQVENNLMVRPL